MGELEELELIERSKKFLSAIEHSYEQLLVEDQIFAEDYFLREVIAYTARDERFKHSGVTWRRREAYLNPPNYLGGLLDAQDTSKMYPKEVEFLCNCSFVRIQIEYAVNEGIKQGDVFRRLVETLKEFLRSPHEAYTRFLARRVLAGDG